MGDLDKVNRTLELRTSHAPEGALASARAAVEGVGRVELARPHVVSEAGDGFRVEIKPTSPVGILLDNTTFVVEARRDGESTLVTVGADDFSVYQQKALFFIPVGPKSVPGVKVYVRCLEAIEQVL